jgi:hypothetical protein
MMAGMITVAPGKQWSAASWLVRWAINQLADNSADQTVATTLRQRLANNLEWITIDDYGPQARENLAATLHRIANIAERELPTDVPNRTAVIANLRELADMTP